jgi:hypothetical protein
VRRTCNLEGLLCGFGIAESATRAGLAGGQNG